MAMNVGELNVRVNIDTKGFSNSLNSIKNQGNTFSNNFSKGVSLKSQKAFKEVGTAGKTTFANLKGSADDNVLKSFTNIGSVGTMAFSAVTTIVGSAVQGLQAFGTAMTQYVTLPIAAAGTAIFTLGKNFERELSKVTGLVGVAGDQVDKWGKDILDLAPKLGKAPQELSEALFFVTSAGLRGADAMDTLEKSGKAAAAGLGETKTVADLVTSAMNAYGIENLSAGQATDILVAAVREGKAEASELAASMGQVLPIAAEMGVSFDQVAAAQAAMTKTGTPATQAATQLKSILSGLIKPSQQAEEQLQKMGTSSSELRKSIKDKGLITTLGDLRKMTNKYGEEAMARVFPNIRALSGVLDLMGSNAEDNIEIFGNVKDSTGSLDEAFKAASETLDFKWNQAMAQVQATAISFFDTLKTVMLPVLENLMIFLDLVGEKFSSLSPKMQQFIVIFGIIAATIGPIILGLMAIFTTLATILVGFIATIIGVYAAFSQFWGILLVVGSAIGVLIGIIAGLVASFIYLWKTNDEFRENTINTWNYIKAKGKEIFEDLKQIIKIVLDKIKSFWAKHGESITQKAVSVWNMILGTIKNVVNIISQTIKLFLSILKGDWSGVWSSVKSITKSAWSILKSIIVAGTKASGLVVKGLVKIISNHFKSILRDIKGFGKSFYNAGANIGKMIAKGISSAIQACKNAASNLVGAVRDFLPFSPAKVGPLSDLDKLDFYSSIKKSLDAATAKINMPVSLVAEKIASGLVKDVSPIVNNGNTNNAKSLVIKAINIHGKNDYAQLQALKNTLRRYSGRLK